MRLIIIKQMLSAVEFIIFKYKYNPLKGKGNLSRAISEDIP